MHPMRDRTLCGGYWLKVCVYPGGRGAEGGARQPESVDRYGSMRVDFDRAGMEETVAWIEKKEIAGRALFFLSPLCVCPSS